MISQAMIDVARKLYYFLRMEEMSRFVPWDAIDLVTSIPAGSAGSLELLKRVSTNVRVVIDNNKDAGSARSVSDYTVYDGRPGLSVAELLSAIQKKPDYIVSLRGAVLEIADYTTVSDGAYRAELLAAFRRKPSKTCPNGGPCLSTCGCSGK